MIGKLNRAYGLFGLCLYLFFIPWVNESYFEVYLLNIITLIVYFIVFNFFVGIKKFDNIILLISVFFISLSYITVYNFISFYYNDNFFVFSESDATGYDYYSKVMASMSVSNSIEYYLKNSMISDLGVVLIISLLYRIIESNLIFNFFNLIMGLITAAAIFRIGKKLMSLRYAFLCAITFSLSSFFLWYHASGLKESLMLTLVVLSLDQWYEYLYNKKYKNIIFGLFFILFLILFRPALTLFIILSISTSIILNHTNRYKRLVIIVCIFIFLITIFPFIDESFNSFLMGGDMQLLIEIKRGQGMVIGSLPFTYIVNILSQLIGQFPTLTPDSSNLSFFSPGLIFKLFISFPFILGIFTILNEKIVKIYPLLFFFLIEAFSLVVILEGLELRKSLPHFPFVFIISFWFMDYYNNEIIKKKKKINIFFNIYLILSCILIIFWNFR